MDWGAHLRILTVAPYVPHDAIRHAGGAYLLQHLHELVKLGNEATLIAPGTAAQRGALALSPSWLDVLLGPPAEFGRSPLRVASDALYRRAMNAPPAPSHEELRSVLGAGLIERAGEADVVELHWAGYARFATVLRRAGVTTPVCVLEHDVELDAHAERVRNLSAGLLRTLKLLPAEVARRQERRGLLHAQLVAVFKRADEQVLRRAGVTTPVQVLDPWLEEPHTPPTTPRPRTALFTGALWRRGNVDGLVWFLDNVWPEVFAQVPNAILQLVGSAPTERLQAKAASSRGVELVGEVPDLMPYYSRASVFVAPLFARGGLKFKVPQAMLCGLPVVATNVACEGVAEVAPSNTLWTVTDSAKTMADGLVSAFKDEAAAATVGQSAAEWCRDHYSFSRSMASLNQAYSTLAEHAERSRGSV
ncbi:MAG TPA: glycosyltransferase [Propionibacteriaceae bacterium]|nr:glycosyltransferase [Propionibacteriaceae bacterium]